MAEPVTLTVHDLSGASCEVVAFPRSTVADVIREAAGGLNVDGSNLLLLRGAELVKEIPQENVSLLLFSRARSEKWDHYVDTFVQMHQLMYPFHEATPASANFFAEMNATAPDILEHFGREFAEEVTRRTKGSAYLQLPAELQALRSVAKTAVQADGQLIGVMDERFRDDKELVGLAIRQLTRWCPCCVQSSFAAASERLQNDPDIYLEALHWQRGTSEYLGGMLAEYGFIFENYENYEHPEACREEEFHDKQHPRKKGFHRKGQDNFLGRGRKADRSNMEPRMQRPGKKAVRWTRVRANFWSPEC